MSSVTNNKAQSRYEVSVGNEVVGFAAYTIADDVVSFTSTQVQPEHQNKGLAADMAKMALDDARAAGLTVKPVCSYFVVYIKRHPEYADLVA